MIDSVYFFDHIKEPEDKEEEDIFLIEESSMFTSLTNGKMLELMTKFNCPKDHAQYVALDLPIP